MEIYSLGAEFHAGGQTEANSRLLLIKTYTVIPRLTSDPAKEFFG